MRCIIYLPIRLELESYNYTNKGMSCLGNIMFSSFLDLRYHETYNQAKGPFTSETLSGVLILSFRSSPSQSAAMKQFILQV